MSSSAEDTLSLLYLL
jgi:hypothetical protein